MSYPLRKDNKSGMSYRSDLEAVEIPLLIDGVFQRYGFDFRGYQPDFLKERIHREIKSQELPSISRLQEKLLHDRDYFDRFLSRLSTASTRPFADADFFRTISQKVIPLLKTYPSIRVWQVGGSVEELYSMAILLHESEMADRATIYFTDASREVLNEAREGRLSSESLKTTAAAYKRGGGTKRFKDYVVGRGEEARVIEPLKQNIAFFQHNPGTDGSFNEFNLIVCRHLLRHLEGSQRRRVLELFENSLCSLGILGLGKGDAPKDIVWHTQNKRLTPGECFFQRTN